MFGIILLNGKRREGEKAEMKKKWVYHFEIKSQQKKCYTKHKCKKFMEYLQSKGIEFTFWRDKK